MFFVVESGSTKSDWVLIDAKNKHKSFTTIGFNPYFHESDFIVEEISKNAELLEISKEISGVYFYGAGCSSTILNKVIEKALTNIFSKAKIVVDHDLLACAYATYSGIPEISCILGTGSNSCYFDGENLSEVRPALGYILGDEGSGSYFGKKLLVDFLYKRLPRELERDFVSDYGLDKDTIVKKVYQEANANVYIASFMPFIAKHKTHAHVHTMLVEGFKEFIDVHVKCFEQYEQSEVNFVGSISYLFQEQLEIAGKESGITIGRIIRKPIDALVEYHEKYIIQKDFVQ